MIRAGTEVAGDFSQHCLILVLLRVIEKARYVLTVRLVVEVFPQYAKSLVDRVVVVRLFTELHVVVADVAHGLLVDDRVTLSFVEVVELKVWVLRR